MKIASKILSIVVVILLLACIAGTLAAFTDGYKNWDVNTWFNAAGTQEAEKTEEKADVEYYDVKTWVIDDGFIMTYANLAENGVVLPKKDFMLKINGEDVKMFYSQVPFEGDEVADTYCSVKAMTLEDMEAMETLYNSGDFTVNDLFIMVYPEETDDIDTILVSKNMAMTVSFEKKTA